MRFIDFRIRSKLLLGFGALAAIVAMVAALALQSLSSADRRFTDYLDGASRRQALAADIRGAATRRAIAARNLVLVTDACRLRTREGSRRPGGCRDRPGHRPVEGSVRAGERRNRRRTLASGDDREH